MFLCGKDVLVLEGTLIKCIFMTKTSWYKLNLTVDRPRASGRRSRNWRPGSVLREPLAPIKLLRQMLWRPSNDWSGRYSVGVLLEKNSFLSSILLQQTHRASPVCVGGDTPVAWCLSIWHYISELAPIEVLFTIGNWSPIDVLLTVGN